MICLCLYLSFSFLHDRVYSGLFILACSHPRSPHIIFLSQSVLCGDREGDGEGVGGERGLSLCGSRLCHELSHSWFGLAIGARDWTEEWISEGFATYLEDIIWARAQQVLDYQLSLVKTEFTPRHTLT